MKEPKEVNKYVIIKINLHQNTSDADSETYEPNIVNFEHGQLEEFLQLMNNFKRAVDGTGTTKVEGKVTYICTLLSGEELQEFYKIAIQNTGTSNAHLKFIQEGILGFFFS